MQGLETEIEFVNHASVLVSGQGVGLLCDPWYSGDAFHKGWNLLWENDPADIEALLERTTHLWLSHEHPDHFSVAFFKRYGELLKRRGIRLLFQTTDDKRVKSFLDKSGFEVKELPFDREVEVAPGFGVTCLKDGFYDSGLLIRSGEDKILNLNDCEVTTAPRAREVHRVTGDVDVLLTQFSFAAWKGGEENRGWREEAAREKLQTMKMQIETFHPRLVVPFASFVYFSNRRNVYLNDAVNTPAGVLEEMTGEDAQIVVMQPYDRLGGPSERLDEAAALAFWGERYATLSEAPLNDFAGTDMAALQAGFETYKARVMRNNSPGLMRAVRKLSPVKAFQPVVVELDDLAERVVVDLFEDNLATTSETPHLRMNSESLLFIFNNTFGYDTLTVNGCFEEAQPGGFVHATKTLAIENLNNLGIHFTPATLFNARIIKLCATRLIRVARKLEA
ncbi:MBL fold metallo-hydrolase [Sulfitobacter sp. D35]|uniref:MBL fold metallo-hydrolase n=1 Tax=Sulfitobacter sp. D35 TaxID=3083252 RepID=UPI00296F0EA2|nr:MBL fold metallo-hydrolase [Sulfitobacter sp. D35]MDW4497760.1 MBL fold metallo-hydrolase [Sulfitobacter sp. D35]